MRISFGLGFIFAAILSYPLFSLMQDAEKNPLPGEALAFPEFSEHYRSKIYGGDYEIWSEEKLDRWCSAQGLDVTRDNPMGGFQYKRAAVITAPGLMFYLTRPVTEKGSKFANGWILNLDIAAITPARARYNNFVEADVFVDGILLQSIEQGTGKNVKTPLQIQIPHIAGSDGKIRIEIRLAHHPRNFLFLYDAFLSR